MSTITINFQVKLTIHPPIILPDIILPPQELPNPRLNTNLNGPISHRPQGNNIPSLPRDNQRPSRNLNRRVLNRNLSSNNFHINRERIHSGQQRQINPEANIRPVEPLRREVNIRQVEPIRREVQQTRIIPQRPVNSENIQPIRPSENSRPSRPIASRRPNPHQHNGQPRMNQIPQILPTVALLNLNQNNINNNNQIDINNKLEDIEITEQILNKSNTKSCVICQQDYNIREKICYLPCFHFYHSQCIRRWVQTSNICPICIIPIDLH